MDRVTNLDQVGGTHYRGLRWDPMTVGWLNCWDPMTFTAAKYLMRHARKGGAQDLDKAIHTIRYRLDLIRQHGPVPKGLYAVPAIRIATELGMANEDRHALTALMRWAAQDFTPGEPDDAAMAESIVAFIQAARRKHYGDPS